MLAVVPGNRFVGIVIVRGVLNRLLRAVAERLVCRVTNNKGVAKGVTKGLRLSLIATQAGHKKSASHKQRSDTQNQDALCMIDLN